MSIKISDYELGEVLGEGKFSQVRLAIHQKTGKKYACKIVDRKYIVEQNKEDQIKREITVASRLHHENIVRLYAFFKSQRHYYLIFELAEHGPIFSRLSKGSIPELLARRYFQQLIDALGYLHANNITHRDLKPENLLLDANDSLKVSGFWLSILVDSQSVLLQTVCGTPNYAAPEVFSGKPYGGPAVDIWSAAVVLYVLITAQLPFEGSTLQELSEKITKCQYKFPPRFPPGPKDLIEKILVFDPNKRLTIDQIKVHPWFAEGWKRSQELPILAPIAEDEIEEETINAFELIGNIAGLTVNDNLASSRNNNSFTLKIPFENATRHIQTEAKKLGQTQKINENTYLMKTPASAKGKVLEILIDLKEITKKDTLITLSLKSGPVNDIGFDKIYHNLKKNCGA